MHSLSFCILGSTLHCIISCGILASRSLSHSCRLCRVFWSRIRGIRMKNKRFQLSDELLSRAFHLLLSLFLPSNHDFLHSSSSGRMLCIRENRHKIFLLYSHRLSSESTGTYISPIHG